MNKLDSKGNVILEGIEDEEEQVARDDVGLLVCNKKGFGFIKVEDGSDDVFIPAKSMSNAFHNDTVRFEIVSVDEERGKKEGKIVEILEHKIKNVVGTYVDCEKFGFIKPDIKNITSDIFVTKRNSKRAKNDDKVIVEIQNYGNGKKGPSGEVIEVLGNRDKPGIDVLSIIREREIPVEFPEDVWAASKRIKNGISEDDLKGRLDMTAERTYTIDGEETKDYDDAVSVRKEGDIYHLGIYIADVTHYVQEGDELDLEAKNRGTSCYPVDRVIPMLPKKLSEGVCSLVEREPRLTLSCLMDFDNDGNLIGKKIVETVITVNKRLTYNQVAQALDNPETVTGEMKNIYPDLTILKELTDKLRKKRTLRGAVDFEFAEANVKLDKDGHPIEIVPRTRNTATQIIEELMLTANETVAEFVTLDTEWKGTPLIYRSHEKPDAESLENLKKVVMALGFKFPINLKDIKSEDVQALVEEVKGTDDEYYIQMMTLRCMKRASYSTAVKEKVEKDGEEVTEYVPIGHFGLAAPYYCHFTSPIRRYADLINHRVIKSKLHGTLTDSIVASYRKSFPDIAQHVSETEYRSLQAERDTVSLKMAEFMKDRIGEEYDAVISGVAQWGIYVELPNTINGLIPVASLEDGYYEYDESRLQLVRETGGRSFRIGQKLRVRVEDADTELKNITFSLVKEL